MTPDKQQVKEIAGKLKQAADDLASARADARSSNEQRIRDRKVAVIIDAPDHGRMYCTGYCAALDWVLSNILEVSKI